MFGRKLRCELEALRVSVDQTRETVVTFHNRQAELEQRFDLLKLQIQEVLNRRNQRARRARKNAK